MSIIKSFSVGNGDMFYIRHGSDSFTIIDCHMNDDNYEDIVEEIKEESSGKGILRFISSHPDNDHIKGLKRLDDEFQLLNFYCVENQATKPDDTVDFTRYCKLRDSDKAFYVRAGCQRKWLNQSDDEPEGRGGAGISMLWPKIENEFYKKQLDKVANGESPNNISLVTRYKLKNGATVLWMGDLETDFMENIKNDIDLPEVDILFAPHHGRDSGKVPSEMLETMSPKIIIIGEAPSGHLNYYQGYNTITQNSAKDIVFECVAGMVHIYVSSSTYSVNFLTDKSCSNKFDCTYIGTLDV